MGPQTQYVCATPMRRALDEDHNFNGIDYLEVLDSDAPKGLPGPPPEPDSPPQRTLIVWCLSSLASTTITAANVHISGGVRITPIHVAWAYRLGDILGGGVPAHTVTQAELAYFSSAALAATSGDQAKIFIVRTASSGDFSQYHLTLSKSPSDLTPLPNFDPQLSAIDFSFKVECPSDFDCQPAVECPPEQLVEPVISYLAKDYGSFRTLMLDRMATVMPGWQERNPADLGVMLVEVLAYAADHLSYYQDAVATEAYLDTARRRVSVRRHARLLDYAMHDGCNARTWVCVEVDTSGNGIVLRRHDPAAPRTRFLSRCLPDVVVADAKLQDVLNAFQPEVFEPLHDAALYTAHNTVHFYTWANDDCCLPKGATHATLLDDPANRLRLMPGDVLIFEERLGTDTGLPWDANIAHRCAVRLVNVTPSATLGNDNVSRVPASAPLTDPVNGQAIVEIDWDPLDALPLPFCLSKHICGAQYGDVSIARGNAILVDSGLTVAAETLAPSRQPPTDPCTGVDLPYTGIYRLRLQQPNLTFGDVYDPSLTIADPDSGLPRTQAAVLLLSQDPRLALPAIALADGADEWTPVRDLFESDRFARDFVVEMENDGTAYLRFGDDILGKRPDPGHTFAATYRVGNGSAGNVGAEAIAHIVTGQPGITRVRNPLPALGGTDAESLDAVKQYAPVAFRTQERAVTTADYVEVAQRHPEVQRAAATLRWTGSWYTMFVTVERVNGLPLDETFKAEMRGFLERFRMAGCDLEIEPPVYVPLDIAFSVCVKPGYFRGVVEKALLDTFSARDLPDGRRGFFHPANFTFGQPVYLSQVIAAAMGVPGVDWIDTTETPLGSATPHRFQRIGEVAGTELRDGQILMDRLEIAQLANDPSLPENGKLLFYMEGGI